MPSSAVASHYVPTDESDSGIAPLLNMMLEDAERSGKPLPTDDFDLATYVQSHVDTGATIEERRALFHTLRNFIAHEKRGSEAVDVGEVNARVPSPVSHIHDAMEVSATTSASMNDHNQHHGTLNAMPSIEVMAATARDGMAAEFAVASPVEGHSVAVASNRSVRSGSANNDHQLGNLRTVIPIPQEVDRAERARCDAHPHSIYILLGDAGRCENPAAEPKAQPGVRFKVVAPLNTLSRTDPFHMYETAERYVEEGFHLMSTWAEAADKFKAASAAFENAGMPRMAANSLVRVHDVYKAVSSFDRELLDDAAYALVAASRLHSRETPAGQDTRRAALACMQTGISIFEELGRELTAAKLLREAAELCILVKNAGLAIDVLHRAAKTFILFGQNNDARACFARAAEIAVMDFSDFTEAIDTLEKMAKVTPSTETHLAYFRALVCRIVCVPPVPGVDTYAAIQDVKKTFEDYQDQCHPFTYGAENKLVKEVIAKGLEGMDEIATETAIAVYMKSHSLQIEDWLEMVLRKIHKNIVSRKLAIDRTHTL